MLKENSTVKILIEGHTDNIGNKASNQTLSEQRAASLKKPWSQKELLLTELKPLDSARTNRWQITVQKKEKPKTGVSK